MVEHIGSTSAPATPQRVEVGQTWRRDSDGTIVLITVKDGHGGCLWKAVDGTRRGDISDYELRRRYHLVPAQEAEQVPILTMAATLGSKGPVDDIAILLMTAWGVADPKSSVSQHPASYVATFADMARAVIASQNPKD